MIMACFEVKIGSTALF